MFCLFSVNIGRLSLWLVWIPVSDSSTPSSISESFSMQLTSLSSLPLSHCSNICSPAQIHQLPGEAAEGLTFPEDLSGQTSWNFLTFLPIYEQLAITPMISARASFLVVKFYNAVEVRGSILSIHREKIYQLSIEKSSLPIPTASVWVGRGKYHPSY